MTERQPEDAIIKKLDKMAKTQSARAIAIRYRKLYPQYADAAAQWCRELADALREDA